MKIIGLNQKDELLENGCISLGKKYENSILSDDIDIFLDITKPHLILICGKRGTGKSYTMGNIIEGIFMGNPKIIERTGGILVDTMGIYYSLIKMDKIYDSEAISSQYISMEQIEQFVNCVEIIVPSGLSGIYRNNNLTFTKAFSFLPNEIELEDWCSVFDFEPTTAMALLFNKILSRMSEQHGDLYNLDDILNEIDYLFEILEEEKIKRRKMLKALGYSNVKSVSLEALKARVIGAKNWGLFSSEGEAIENLISPGKLTIIDLSLMPNIQGIQNLRGLILALLLRKLYEKKKLQRRIMDEKLLKGEIDEDSSSILWIFVDEAHQFFPSSSQTPASPVFSTLVREGRQPGFSLVFATQQPGKIHSDAISQCDIVISHRVDSQADIQSLNNIKYAYMKNELKEELIFLPNERGYAVVLDDNTNSIFSMNVKKRISSHQGGEPDLKSNLIKLKKIITKQSLNDEALSDFKKNSDRSEGSNKSLKVKKKIKFNK